jgi:two-component system, OmpR family, response regulator ChvI
MKKILVVDDEPDITTSVMRGLQRRGLVVDSFNDPEEALKRFIPGAYDLAILDIKMPKLNGFELFREIRNRDGQIRVFFFTAFESYRTEFMKAFPELDERRFVKKPVGIDLLLSQISEQSIR